MDLGPIQIVVVTLDDVEGQPEPVIDAFLALHDDRAVRLMALLTVKKDDNGRLVIEGIPGGAGAQAVSPLVAMSVLGADRIGEERALGVGPGAGVAGDEGQPVRQRWAVSDSIPRGTRAAVAVLEHRWATPLRAAARNAHAVALEDTWVDRADLVGVETFPGVE